MVMGRRRSILKNHRHSSPNSAHLGDAAVQGTGAPVIPFLNHVTEGCSTEDVDPTRCLPLFLSRGRSPNAVRKLKASINGEWVELNPNSMLTGFVSGSPTSAVVPLVGDLGYLVMEYFQNQGMTAEDAEVKKKEHAVWLGVVDGSQLHCALMESREEHPHKWSAFLWKVCVLRSGLPLEEYKKLAVIHNERCREANNFEPTLYTLLLGLRTAHDALFSRRLKESRTGSRGVVLTHREVAEAFDGGCHAKNTTVKQAVSLAIRLCRDAIEAIGSITEQAHPDVVLNCSKLNNRKLTSTDAVLAVYDCRLFKNFLCPSTIRAAGNFINALKEGDSVAQVNTVHRARHWCELNEYKSVKSTILFEQFNLAKRALHEEETFLRIIDSSTWPAQMKTTQENLLRTTIFDDDLKVNEGNDNDVLQSLWSSFKTIFPARARGIEGNTSFGSRARSSSISPAPPPTYLPEPDAEQRTAEQSAEDERLRQVADAKLREDEERRAAALRRQQLRAKADDCLEDSGIKTHFMSVHGFHKDVWTSRSKRFDLIIGTLPSNVTASEAPKFANLCKSVLNAGSYVVIVITEDQFSFLRSAFSSALFKVCDHSYKVIYDPNTLTKRKNFDFPQRQDDMCFIAKSKGAHPSSFLPDFAANPHASPSPGSSAGSFASVTNINACSNKLKMPEQNAPLFSDERSVDIFVHLVKRFSPSGGAVLDPFAGAMTVALACLKTSRPCVSIDKSTPAMKYAMARLRIFATPNATMEKLNMYVDEVDGRIDATEALPAADARKSGESDDVTSDVGVASQEVQSTQSQSLSQHDCACIDLDPDTERSHKPTHPLNSHPNTPTSSEDACSEQDGGTLQDCDGDTCNTSDSVPCAEKRSSPSPHVMRTRGSKKRKVTGDDIMSEPTTSTSSKATGAERNEIDADIEGAASLIAMTQPDYSSLS